MSKINLLSSKIYNRIAAGEVVERPSSVVKELVENSIDAGATKIRIDISDGGITEIKVTDNGCGIEKSELKKAILPHATSKISKLEDLDSIYTLGFRGEALASIASVSKITIVTKTVDAENGCKLYSEGGEDEIISDCAAVNGTEITVNNIFFNTPAREKFLKKPKSEEGEITSIVSKLILGNPNISIIYTVDGKESMQSFGDGLQSAMIAVYGANVIRDCFYIDTEKNGLNIKGYIGKHYFTKSNRSYQSLFVNSRYIANQTIASAIHNAYGAYLMKRQYPFYVLNVSIPAELVDVNVHPNKTDVRFSVSEIIYGSFYSVVSKVLDGSGEALNIVSEDVGEQQVESKNAEKTDKIPSSESFSYLNSVKPPEKRLFDKLYFNDIEQPVNLNKEKVSTNNIDDDIFAENKAYLESLKKNKEKTNESDLNDKFEIKQELIFNERELRYIGQVFNTYLIFDNGEDMYFVDQHAAHERILFDKFNSQILNNKVDVQPLIIPYIFNVNSFEYEYLSNNLSVLNEIGIEIEEFGGYTFKVSALPVCIADISIKKFFDTVLSDITELKKINLTSLLKENIAQKACKAAIKAGYTMSKGDIETLTVSLKGDLGLKCPHGRPVSVKISKNEVEKWFKRII